MVNRNTVVALTFLAVAVCLLLTAANLKLGNLNQDEGWYLYAARQVAQGHYPYRDFAFTQAPVMPFVYALASPLIGKFGLAGGRLVTALFGLLSAVCASWLAARFVSRKWAGAAGLLAFMLVALNVYQGYYTTVVKTYALCGLFLTLGMLSLTFIRTRGKVAECFLAGVFLALAAGTRISAGVALPIVGLYLLFQQRNFGWASWVSFGIGGGLTLIGVFLPLYVVAPDGFVFGVLEYHTLRSPGSLPYLLVLKGGFVSRVVQDYFVAVCLLVALIVLLRFRRRSTEAEQGAVGLSVVWAVALGVSFVHFMAPFPYDDYQVVIYPVFAAAISAGLIRWIVHDVAEDYRSRVVNGLLMAVFLFSLASAFSSPVNQEWMIRGRDRIWWLMKDQPDLAKLQDVGRQLREMKEEGDVLLTQDTYIAVEADMAVPAGLELGPFSYYPEWDNKQAELAKVVNREMLLNMLDEAAPRFAALSGYSLSIQCPEVMPLPDEEHEQLWDRVLARYEVLNEVEHFGQAHTKLVLLKRREDEEAAE